MQRICILTPMFLPVPAVKGGAIEELITFLINKNELNNQYIFDIYTISDDLLEDKYKSSNIIQIKLPKLIIFIQKSINRIFNVFKINKYYDFNKFRYQKVLKEINKKCHNYKAIVVENNMQLYKYIYKNILNKDIPFYFHLHNDLNIQNKSDEDYIFILNSCKKILVVSNFLKNKLMYYGNPEKLTVFSNAIDEKYYQNYQYDPNKLMKLKEKFQLNNKTIIGYIGRIDSEKGLLELLKAFNMINEKKIKLLLICDDFTKIKYKKDYLNELMIEYEKNANNIEITGRIDYNLMPLYYKLIDIVVIPTICEEAFGMVALEAKTLNKKIIYANSGALNEILQDTNSTMVNLDKNFVSNLSSTIKDTVSNYKPDNKIIKYNNKGKDNLKEYYDKFIKIISE